MHPWQKLFWIRAAAFAAAAVFVALAAWAAVAGSAWKNPLAGTAAAALAAAGFAQWCWRRKLQVALSPRAVFPAREGNRVRYRLDGREVLRRMGEEIARAEKRVWITVAFFHPGLVVPGLGGRTFPGLLAEKARAGVDVRLLFWKLEDGPRGREILGGGEIFQGTPADRRILQDLRREGPPLKARWDAILSGCHHQKTCCVDSRIAFCGGVNLVPEACDGTGHEDRFLYRPWHDLAAEIEGPVVGDLEGNFIQRWNEAKESAPWPDAGTAGTLEYPKDALGYRSLSTESQQPGTARVQLVRTIGSRRYSKDLDVPGPGLARPGIRRGESSLVEAYLELLGGAEESLYLENQYFFFEIGLFRMSAIPRRYRTRGPGGKTQHVLTRAVQQATERGVCVWLVLPGTPQFRGTHRRHLEMLRGCRQERLGLFSLAGQYHSLAAGPYVRDIYVHSKLFLADKKRVCVGSGNLSFQSLHRDSEAALLIEDFDGARSLLERLWEEHLGPEGARIARLPAQEALAAWKELAGRNAGRLQRGESLSGRVLPVPPAAFGESLSTRFASAEVDPPFGPR